MGRREKDEYKEMGRRNKLSEGKGVEGMKSGKEREWEDKREASLVMGME